jgi:hypothetical protein
MPFWNTAASMRTAVFRAARTELTFQKVMAFHSD